MLDTMRPLTLLFITLCVVHVLCDQYPNQFTADLAILDKDGSTEKYTWYYDSAQNAEKLVFQGLSGENTTELRLYSQKKLFFVVGDSCVTQDLSEDTILPPATRISHSNMDLQRVGFQPGPVHPSVFDIPSACLKPTVRGGEDLCNACVIVLDQVVVLGCNATSEELGKLCGKLFLSVCKLCIHDLCSGVCAIEECAVFDCCAVDFCTGASCKREPTPPPSNAVAIVLLLSVELNLIKDRFLGGLLSMHRN